MPTPLPFEETFSGTMHLDLAPPRLVELALLRGEVQLADNGAAVAITVPHTGRSPKDKYIALHPASKDELWWDSVNRPLEPGDYAALRARIVAHLDDQPELFRADGWAGADPRHRLAVRLVTERAWHAHFFRCLLRRVEPAESFLPQLRILHAPGLTLEPGLGGIHGSVAIALNFEASEILIAGTNYAGEIKKAVFSFLNGWLPGRGVFPMHCSANLGTDGQSALLFGLSGTGKTTLSADPERRLIGDDEHGWSDDGIFNFEGGCYAKCINLTPEGEPLIWNAIRFGSIVENVVMDPRTRRIDFTSDAITENTRAAYPLEFIPGADPSGRGGPPRTILFLTCDAYGVLPPLARLTLEQAQYHFLSGYTAKLAGTEQGVKTPQATFSTCFGAPFLTRPPSRYAKMLRERLERARTPVWLVNTGWTGGAYGVGRRMSLAWTRTLVRAALAGTLDQVSMAPDPVFGVLVPEACPGVPSEVLKPRSQWQDRAAYDEQAAMLARLFRNNFVRFADDVDPSVSAAGPRV